jgi:regulator of protease activity HflC (stomatin/prohibitin superfamily)
MIQAVAVGILLVIALVVAYSSIRITREYERGVVFRLGRLIDLKGPGIFLILPFGIDRLTRVDLRVVTHEVPTQEVVTLDNVTVKVNAVVFFQVVDARAAITRVINYGSATSLISQTTLRSILGQSSLDELLASRDKINQSLQQVIDQHTEPWGIKVRNVEVKHVELPTSMQRAMARQAEAEREKRAKIISAEGEFQAAQTLTNAAGVMAAQPAALALRYMQTLLDMGPEKTSTIVFPLPLELIRPLLGPLVADGDRRPRRQTVPAADEVE